MGGEYGIPGVVGSWRGSSPTRAFTFLEIMAVVVIIGILMALVGQTITHHVLIARINACKTQLNTFSSALHTFELDTGRLPDQAEGLAVLLESPSDAPAGTWHGPYIDNDVIPLDPWGNPYQYTAPGEHRVEFDLWSWGPDRADQTNDDIGNWTRSDPS